jgi:hypothetical protein
MTTSLGRGCDNDVQTHARASHRGQSPGFQRIRIGELLITALYDGFVAVRADDLHGAPPAEIRRLLAEAFLPPEGDHRTAVIAFLVGLQIMIDTGSGDSLGHGEPVFRAPWCTRVTHQSVGHVTQRFSPHASEASSDPR